VKGKSIPDQRAQLDLIALGHVDPMVLSVAAANIQGVFRLATNISAVRPRPSYAYIPSRGQYDAAKIIKSLAAEQGGAPLKLAITPYDLCISILTYVYGESQLGGRVAVVSTNRLIHPLLRERTLERIAKICVHEVGHIFGLEHCWETGCLMRFSKQLEQLDKLSLLFCSACEYEIARRLKRMFEKTVQE
jgi:archaemetzincin